MQTLTEFLPADSALSELVLDVAAICKNIAHDVSQGATLLSTNHRISTNVQGEEQKPLDVISNDYFLSLLDRSNALAGLLSEELDVPLFSSTNQRAPYLLVIDPLDGSSNIDVNVSIGSIFSILHTPEAVTNQTRDLIEQDFLQAGRHQVAAGYVIYGPVTMFVLTLGTGTHGFTLDRTKQTFVLTHPNIRVAPEAKEFAINMSNSRFWQAPVHRYIAECLEGQMGIRDKDFNMRWVASLVAETHRILMRGGVFLYPQDNKDPSKTGRLRLLYETNPIGMIIEQAGGRASTASFPMLSVIPSAIHQRIGFVFGSTKEVERIEHYHHNGQ